MNDTSFFDIALNLITAETEKLEKFCSALENNPLLRKEKIAAYKCAKYRYAGAINVWCRFFHSHRVAKRNAETHYLIPELNDIFITIPEYVTRYENAPEGQKRDYALYYGTIAFANSKMAEWEAKLPNATDWEKVELQERIGGLQIAKECLEEAWRKRKDVIG